ncbi:MAG: GGDEF domain-containing protein [Burkholderiales bacterium]
MSKLIETMGTLNATRDFERLERDVVELLVDVLRPRSIRIFHLVHDGGVVRVCSAIDADAGGVRVASIPLERDGLPAIEAFPVQKSMLERGQGGTASPTPAGFSLTMRPISDGRVVMGWMEIETPLPLSHDHVRLVDGLLKINANHLAILDHGKRDPLTGLLHRKSFDEAFLRLRALTDPMPKSADDDNRRRPVSDDHHHWLAVADIDHFKRINDRHGHLYGDEVLVLFSRLLRTTFRLTDQLFRFGGEEFVILLDKVRVPDVRTVFELLRMRAEAMLLRQGGDLSISLGYTLIRADDSATGAFRRADEALHFAKQHGRNRTCSYERLIRAGEIRPRRQSQTEVELF